MIKAILSFCTVVLSAFIFTTAYANDDLNAIEVKQLFSGHTVDAYSEIKKATVSLYYDVNGEVRGIFSNGKKGTTRWWVQDDGKICLKGKTGDACFLVVESNGEYQKYMISDDGSRKLVFSMETFSTGNVNGY